MLIVAVLARFTNLINLQEPWSALTSWWIIGLLIVLLVIEEFADKVPAIDTVNNVVQTLIRPTAGAILFAATTQESIGIHPIFALGCGLLLSGTVHVAKTGARPVLAAATAGAASPVVSTIEDVVATITSLVAIIFPYLIALWFLLMIALIAVVIRRRRTQRLAREARQ